jgi:hypothetical protein
MSADVHLQEETAEGHEDGMNIVEKTVNERVTPWRRDVAGMVQTRRAVDGAAAELIEWAKALEDENLRLQALVCHLLRENEQLRNRNPGRTVKS